MTVPSKRSAPTAPGETSSAPGRPRQASSSHQRGRRLAHHSVYGTFHQLTGEAGLRQRPGGRPPRVHDLRHAFAVGTLLRWYRDGGDVQARLPLLSTYLGHVRPSSTYWYYSDSRVIPMPAPSRA